MDPENSEKLTPMTDLLPVTRFADGSFPLSRLPSQLLERIVTKVGFKTYCRLQQTCKKMKELAQTQNIRVGLYLEDRRINVRQWTKNDSGCNKLEVEMDEIYRDCSILGHAVLDFESLYGIRFDYFPVRINDAMQFEEFCNLLSKYRLSADNLTLAPSTTSFSKEHCAKLLDSFKPYWIRLDISSGNRGPYEACLQAKQLEIVTITVDPNDSLEIISTLITRIPDLRVKTTVDYWAGQDDWSDGHFINCFEKVVKMFRCELPQSFKSLHIDILSDWISDDIVQELKDTLPDVDFYPDDEMLPTLWHFYLKNNMEYTRSQIEFKNSKVSLYFERRSLYPIFDLPSNLLERVITKLEYISFFRLQRTCKDIGQIVQTNKNINIRFLGKKWEELYWEDDRNGESKLWALYPSPWSRNDERYNSLRTYPGELNINFDTFYGVCFREFPIPKKRSEAQFDEFCNFLKKYRITSTDLEHGGRNAPPYSIEQYVKLLNILKPSTIHANLHVDPNLFEACLQAFHTTHQKVTLCISHDQAVKVLKRLLFGPISRVHMQAHCVYRLVSIDEFHKMLIPFLELLRSGPSISSVSYFARLEGTADSEEDLMEVLRDYEPVLSHMDAGISTITVVDFAPFPDGSICQLIIAPTCAKIHWNLHV